MINKLSTALVALTIITGLVVKECDAFQPPRTSATNSVPPIIDGGSGPTSQLGYQDAATLANEDTTMTEFDRQSLMYSQPVDGGVSNGVEGQEELYYQAEQQQDPDEYYEPEEEYIMYNEDGTIFETIEPTLELLQEWTQEYIDAVDLAGGGITRLSVGVQNMLAEDYVFTSPTIGPISKPDFIQLMSFYLDSGFDIASAVPDFTTYYDGWHQDPHEPWRVWAVVRYAGTHTGTAIVPQSGLKLTPPNDDKDHPMQFMTGPELHSFLWTPDKQMLWQTMGYVGDAYTGSNQGKGGLQGLMVSMGLPTLYLDSTAPLRKSMAWFSQFSDNGKEPRSKSPYSALPQWWHERKMYDMNIHR